MSKKITNKDCIQSLHALCSEKFDKMTQLITDVHDKVHSLENKVSDMQSSLQDIKSKSAISNHEATFTKIENKVDYLNEHLTNTGFLFPKTHDSILQLIHSETIIQETDVQQILKGHVDIYELFANRIGDLVESYRGKCSFLYAFAFQKYVIYFWNQEKISWDKASDSKELKHIFEVLQQKTITLYNIMIQKSNPLLAGIDIIECAENLFDNRFEKKCLNFKKNIFNRLIIQ